MSELASLSTAGAGHAGPMVVAPWFRGDLAFDRALVPGAERILAHVGFRDAAERLYGLPVVVPQQVYLNLNPPIPQLDPGHVDVPTFRGVDRTNTPVWLLAVMKKSGLFERWAVPIATAVAWFYEGEGGGYRYWPDGPDAPPVDRPCRSNTALVGDNDRTFHAVLAVGAKPTWVPGLTLDARLVPDDGGFRIEQDGAVRARYPRADVRISLSWKALCFEDEAAHARFRARQDALDHAQVVATLVDALRSRGHEASVPDDPLGDRPFIDLLNRVFHAAPTVFTPRAAPAREGSVAPSRP